MNKKYSANEELKNLAQNLDFKVYLFDDSDLGPEIKLKEESKKEEIEKIKEIKEKFEFEEMTTALRYIINFSYDVLKKFNFFKEE